MRSLVCALLASAGGFRRLGQEELTATRHVEGVPVFELALVTAPSGQWIVFLKEGADDAALESFCSKADCKTMGHASNGGIPFVVMRATEDSLAEALRSNADVDFVTPDYILETDIDPSPEDAAQAEREAAEGTIRAMAGDWGLTRIGVPSAKYTGKNVNVYVFDTGVDYFHEEFEKIRPIPTLDWSKDEDRFIVCNGVDKQCATDYYNHGTHVAGIVGGSNYGVAPDVTIHAVSLKFRQFEFQTMLSGAYAGFDWLIINRQLPAVLQMSFGFDQVIPGSEVAINKVIEAGIVVVAAAGNGADNACRWTWGHIPGVIVVAASDSRDQSAKFNNYGACITLYAPGVNITSAHAESGYVSKSGTSMAAPMVSGGAALLLEANPALTPAQVKALLVENAERDVIENVWWGTPNLLLRVGETAPSPAPAPTPGRECPRWCSALICDVFYKCKVCAACQ